MEKTEIKKEDLEEYLQIHITIVGTKGALKEDESEYSIYTKEELVKQLDKIFPEEDFGYSILSITKNDDKGI